jgi:hypothetical protein
LLTVVIFGVLVVCLHDNAGCRLVNRGALEELVAPKEEEARLEGLLYFGDSKVNCFATGEVDGLRENLGSFEGAGLDEIEGKLEEVAILGGEITEKGAI